MSAPFFANFNVAELEAELLRQRARVQAATNVFAQALAALNKERVEWKLHRSPLGANRGEGAAVPLPPNTTRAVQRAGLNRAFALLTPARNNLEAAAADMQGVARLLARLRLVAMHAAAAAAAPPPGGGAAADMQE